MSRPVRPGLPAKATRVAVLLILLAVSAMWASSRTSARRARTDWAQPVRLAVLVIGEVPPPAMAMLRATLEALARRLDAVRAHHDPAAAEPAFQVEAIGPLRVEPPPVAPPGPGLLDRALHAWTLWRATRSAHASAPGFDPGAWDVRVYLVAAPPAEGAPRFAEGLGEQGGEVGVVRARFDDEGALLAATAVFHEAFHCLGATDKYDALGHAVLPGGLAEPDLQPRLPQRLAELMVGEVPLDAVTGRLPSGVDEVGVGPATAAEIGWLEPPGGPPGQGR